MHDHAQEKNQLLRQWLLSGENVEACEARMKIQREQGVEGERIWQQIAVKDMGAEPYRFSENRSYIRALHSICMFRGS